MATKTQRRLVKAAKKIKLEMNLVGQLGKTQSNRVSTRKNPVKPSGNERNQDNLIPVITDYFIETQ